MLEQPIFLHNLEWLWWSNPSIEPEEMPFILAFFSPMVERWLDMTRVKDNPVALETLARLLKIWQDFVSGYIHLTEYVDRPNGQFVRVGIRLEGLAELL